MATTAAVAGTRGGWGKAGQGRRRIIMRMAVIGGKLWQLEAIWRAVRPLHILISTELTREIHLPPLLGQRGGGLPHSLPTLPGTRTRKVIFHLETGRGGGGGGM